jgi:DNA replication protein DnaC
MFQLTIPSTVILCNPSLEIDRILKISTLILKKYTPEIIAVLMGKPQSNAYEMCGDFDNNGCAADCKSEYNKIISDNGDSMLDKGMSISCKRELEERSRIISDTATAETSTTSYSLEGLNVVEGVPLQKVIYAVKKFRDCKDCGEDAPRMNILLSGPPGCGKTAFVNHLSNLINAPLITISASDILSPMLGSTEQKIASYFKKAKETNSILFLDEFDAFLVNREAATRSYEVSQTTELMLQMEKFGGVMIAATNFERHLDNAVLRRFTLKIRMGYLSNQAKAIFFERFFKTPLNLVERARLDAIELTPGDYRSARERLFYTSDTPNNDECLAALEFEATANRTKPIKIGFN